MRDPELEKMLLVARNLSDWLMGLECRIREWLSHRAARLSLSLWGSDDISRWFEEVMLEAGLRSIHSSRESLGIDDDIADMPPK